MIKILPISGVVDNTWINLMNKVSTFWQKPLYYNSIPYNSNARMIRYDQGKTKECTIYACCGALCNNTWIDLLQHNVEEIANKFTSWGGLSLYSTAKKVADMFWKKIYVFHEYNDACDQLLKKWYELVVSLITTTDFYRDWVTDWVVNTHYTKGVDMNHAIRLKWNKNKWFFLVNSWGKYIEKWFHNEYEIDMRKCVKNKLFRLYIFII